jgi:hypothetical protein
MGHDDRAPNARSFIGLDAHGEGRAQGRSAKPSTAVPAAQAAAYLLASVPQRDSDVTRAHWQATAAVGHRARSRAPACSVVRKSESECDMARASGVRGDDPEGVERICLPPHGPPSQAVWDLTKKTRGRGFWSRAPASITQRSSTRSPAPAIEPRPALRRVQPGRPATGRRSIPSSPPQARGPSSWPRRCYKS